MAVTKVFQAVVPDCIWVSERSLWFSGVRIRSRTTVVRLVGDALWEVRWHTRANSEVVASIAQLRALPLERILVSHADPITRPLDQLAAAWSFAVPEPPGFQDALAPLMTK